MARADSRDATARLVAHSLASGVPLLCYLATASAHAYWLDAGEFVAQGVSLGISHPPGHPLSGLVTAAAARIPLGAIELRVALASAVLCAAAAGFLCSAVDQTLRALGVVSGRVSLPLAVGAAWLSAFSYGWWFQAVRPEVYGLQAALVCFAIERVVALEARWPTGDLRPLYAACLALGLALANHHFLAFLLLPALAPTLARVYGAHGGKPLGWALGALGLGLSTYLYLPLRAGAAPYLNLGEPTSADRVYWVVSAQAFQANQGSGVPDPLADRFAQVAEQLVLNLHWAPLVLALLGMYVLLRVPSSRRVGWVWASVLVVFCSARAWLGFVRDNPDALGYLQPAFGAISAMAAAAIAAILLFVGSADSRRPGWFVIVLAFAAGAASIAQLPASVDRGRLDRFTATDAFDDPIRRDVAPRAVVLAHSPQTIFRYWGGEATERLRPDVTVVPIPFLPYPGMIDSLVERDPDLAELLRGYLLSGELRQPELQSLATRRPLLVEMDVRVSPRLYETLVPRGLYHEVLAEGATDGDEREGAFGQDKAIALLYANLGDQWEEPETRAQLLWRHYTFALYYAGFGDRESAREAARLGLEISPESEELLMMQGALVDESQSGPLDVTQFMPSLRN